ncbi:MAG: phage tail protein [Synergistaceae bacterium]|nr:phage tail protein [Synergistaceae bacterium]
MINIQIGSAGVERAKKLLAHIPKAFSKAQSAAIARTLDHMKTRAAQLASSKYYAKSGEIKRAITVQKKGQNAGAMISRGARKSLADYKISPAKQKLGRRQGKLRGAVKKDGGLKNLGKAFLIPSGGRYLPYIRVGRGRWDIKRLMSPAIPQIIGNEEITQELSQEAGRYFDGRLRHEVMRQLGVFAK